MFFPPDASTLDSELKIINCKMSKYLPPFFPSLSLQFTIQPQSRLSYYFSFQNCGIFFSKRNYFNILNVLE